MDGHGRGCHGTYRTEQLGPAHELVLVGYRDAIEVENELGEQLAVVALPLTDGLEVVRRALDGVLCRSLVLAGGLELACQGGGLGAAAADQAMPSGFGIVDLDQLLFQRGLPVAGITLLAGVGALALAANGRGAEGRVGGILKAGQRHAPVGHGDGNGNLGGKRHGDSGHAGRAAGGVEGGCVGGGVV